MGNPEKNTDSAEEEGGQMPQEPYPWRNTNPTVEEAAPESEEAPEPETEEHPSPPPREQNTPTGQTFPPETHQKRAKQQQPAGSSVQRRERAAKVKRQQARLKAQQEKAKQNDEAGLLERMVVVLFEGAGRLWHFVFLAFALILPWATGTTGKYKGLSGRFYPDDMLSADERVLYAGRPSRWVSPGPYILGVGLIAAAIAMTVMVPLGYGEVLVDGITPSFVDVGVPGWWWVVPLVLVAVAYLFLLRQALFRASTWHLVTTDRILYRKNVIAPHRKRVDYADINRVDDHHPIPERWYGVGDIDIYTASTDGKELTLSGVSDVGKVMRLIDRCQSEKGGGAEQQGQEVDTRQGHYDPHGKQPHQEQESRSSYQQKGRHLQQDGQRVPQGENRREDPPRQGNSHQRPQTRSREAGGGSASGPGEEDQSHLHQEG